MMATTLQMKVYTGTGGATENPSSGSAINFNFLSTDSYDSVGTAVVKSPVERSTSGNAYSYERIVRISFSGNTETLSSVKAYAPSLDLPTGVSVNVGVSNSASSPINTVSSVALTPLPTTLGTAIDITPTGGVTVGGGYTKYLYLQFVVASTATVDGDIGKFGLRISY